MNVSWYLCGYREYTVPVVYAECLLNLCMDNGLVYSHLQYEEEVLRFCCTQLTAKRLESACTIRQIPLTCTRHQGRPAFFQKHRKRVGILMGFLLSTILGILLSQMIWSIQIDGNEVVSTGEVLEQLEAAGLRVGSLRSQVDPDDIELQLLLSSDSLSWASVNLRGTVATVQIREKKLAGRIASVEKPANIIAGEAGRIMYTQVLRGNPLVTIGDTVSKGDLLISGIFDNTQNNFRITRAAGSVFAEAVRQFQIEIPLSYVKSRAIVSDHSEIWISFFGKEIKVFKSTGNPTDSCDTIESVREYSCPDGKALPFSVRTIRSIAFTDEKLERTPEQAEKLAYYQLSGEISEWLSKDGVLLRKRIEVTHTDAACILTCTAVGVRNIAVVSEFELELSQN